MISELALEAVLLRPTNERMDVLYGIEEIIRSSFVEVYELEKDQEKFLSVPLVAMVFGKKKLAVSPMKSAIEADTFILRAFGNVQPSDVSTGIGPRIEKLFRHMGEIVSQDNKQLQVHLQMLEFIARKYPKAWLMLASLYEESGVENRLEKAKQAVQRFLEEPDSSDEVPEAWKMLATYCNRTEDWLGEIHAYVELAQLPPTPFFEVSNIANTLNKRLRFELLTIESEEKQILVNKMIDVMDSNLAKADATDLSRVAWLAMNIRDDVRARKYTEIGLELDSYNEHIQSLARHLHIYGR